MQMSRYPRRGPYFLLGKCFGGLVAIEIARSLSERGEHIGALALLDAFPTYSGFGRCISE